jgi:hypothetical protein
VQTECEAAMIDDGTDLTTSNLHRNNKAKNNSAAKINTNTTAVGIIIESLHNSEGREIMYVMTMFEVYEK